MLLATLWERGGASRAIPQQTGQGTPGLQNASAKRLVSASGRPCRGASGTERSAASGEVATGGEARIPAGDETCGQAHPPERSGQGDARPPAAGEADERGDGGEHRVGAMLDAACRDLGFRVSVRLLVDPRS